MPSRDQASARDQARFDREHARDFDALAPAAVDPDAEQHDVAAALRDEHVQAERLERLGEHCTKLNSPLKGAFLSAFAVVGIVGTACRHAGCSRSAVYLWLKEDERFKELYDQAAGMAADLLEEEAHRRAVLGTLEPIYQGGVLVGWKRKYSDVMLAMMLNGAKPEKYKYRQEISGPNGGPIEVRPVVDRLLDKLVSMRERRALPEPVVDGSVVKS